MPINGFMYAYLITFRTSKDIEFIHSTAFYVVWVMMLVIGIFMTFFDVAHFYLKICYLSIINTGWKLDFYNFVK